MIFKPGDVTNKELPCEILRRLPGSSMAEIYLAQLINTKHRMVVKGVGQDAPQSLQAVLKKEVRVLHGLRQESIPEFYGYFEEPGRNYYVMSYHNGSNLEDYLRQQGSISERQVQKIALDLCRTLAYLHKKSVVYGDLKPSNVLIADKEVILLDYGAAGYLGEEQEDIYFQGTIGYAAPECWRSGQLTYAVDIFALGAMLYRMLEGQEPKERFGRFALSSPQKKNRWQSVLDKCCALDAGRRYQSIAQVYEVISKRRL